jgi:hypothetical protein
MHLPDKLDLALVLEKNEAVFLRDRLVLIDELDEVALSQRRRVRIFRRRAVVA